MVLSEYWLSLDLAATGSVVLVLDASESAQEHLDEILGLGHTLLSQLPGKTESHVYFLGSGKRYEPGEFAMHSAQWVKENAGRTSLIGPVLKELKAEANMKVVVIGCGTIFDLDDWADDPLAECLVLARFGESLQPPGGAWCEIKARGAHNTVVGAVNNRVVRIEIAGAGFLPLAWTNPGYALKTEEGRFLLAADALDDYGVRVRMLGVSAESVQARLVLNNDETMGQGLSISQPFKMASAELGTLSAQDVEIFRRCVNHQSFSCPHCREEHPWWNVCCDNAGGLLPPCVLRSVPREAKGFLVLRDRGDSVVVEEPPGSVFWLGENRAAVLKGGHAPIYQLDVNTNQWRASGSEVMPQYSRVEKGAYVIVV